MTEAGGPLVELAGVRKAFGDNVVLGGVPEEEARRRARDLLARVGIPEKATA